MAECDQRRVFLTGFTGSCGKYHEALVILHVLLLYLLLTDFRAFILL